MATTSEAKSALDNIAKTIADSAQRRANAKAMLLTARNQLAALPQQYADAITTIDGYTPTGAFETLHKDEKTKLQSEFTALKSAMETELTALGVSF